MDTLRVRVYNVRFGDAILVSAPDRTAGGAPRMRHILIDMGNVRSGDGGVDQVFAPVAQDILNVLDGQMLDLYVMTHEHLDHVQGLPYLWREQGITLDVRHAWLTASSEVGYYERFPDAKRQLSARLSLYEEIDRYLHMTPALNSPAIQALMLNNSPHRTDDCVAYLRGLANRTTYVYRGCALSRRHTFQDTGFQVLAPERDTSTYYGRFQPMALGGASLPAGGVEWENQPIPPAGVDAGAFYNLVDFRTRGWMDNLLAIDRAANNTSVVFQMEWRGWRLLFAGDAEQRSWREMHKRGVLGPVHFLKVSHHCSHTGMPDADILDTILPPIAPDGRERHAAISTYHETYHNVPDEETRQELGRRCTLHTTEGLSDGEFVDIEFVG
jgi:beta-lactamase superfamily II metal-dependent hydrolase